MQFSTFLKQIRSTAGYTQQDIAQILKTDRSTYAYSESGKTEPNIRSLRRIANLYAISVDELINCRIEPSVRKLSAPDPSDTEALSALRKLSRDERSLVMLYRACSNKEALLELVRNFEDETEESD